MRRSFVRVIPLILLVAAAAGCAHKGPATPKPVKAPVVLNADDQHAKVIFKMISPISVVSFSMGPAGNLSPVGKVYDEASQQDLPAFSKGLFKGITQGIYRVRPSRELLVPAGQQTVVEGTANWREQDAKWSTGKECGPVSRSFTAKANATYLVEFDLQDMYVCHENVYDVTLAGHKDLVAPLVR